MRKWQEKTHMKTILTMDMVKRRAEEKRGKKKKIPTHISIHSGEGNITMDSTVLLEQIRTIDKFRLQKYVGSVSDDTMDRVDRAMLISLGLSNSA